MPRDTLRERRNRRERRNTRVSKRAWTGTADAASDACTARKHTSPTIDKRWFHNDDKLRDKTENDRISRVSGHMQVHTPKCAHAGGAHAQDTRITRTRTFI